MKRISIDVLITFYNQDKYAEKAIQSVLFQKGDFSLHLLIGDDGSSDNTLSIAEHYASKNPGMISIFQMPREKGKKYIGGFRASQNRLNLLKHVQADYFIFLDGDDYFDDEHKLQKQVDILENMNNQDCVACGHAIDAVYPDGTRKPYGRVIKSEGKYDLKTYWKNVYFHTDTILARSSAIKNVPCGLVENNYNDNLITFLILQTGKIYYIPETMAVYRQTGDGIWTSSNMVVNHIRNMFMYDLCNQINPDMKKETTRRLSSVWLSLLRIRRQINAAQLQPFSDEAKDKHLVNSYNWIHYQELSLWEKQALCIKAVCLSRRTIVRGVLSKTYHMLIK